MKILTLLESVSVIIPFLLGVLKIIHGWYMRMSKKIDAVLAAAEIIKKNSLELKPNGGSSVNDRVGEIQTHLNNVHLRLDQHDASMASVKSEVSQLKGMTLDQNMQLAMITAGVCSLPAAKDAMDHMARKRLFMQSAGNTDGDGARL